MAQIIRVDVIEHRATGSIHRPGSAGKGTSDKPTNSQTPEEKEDAKGEDTGKETRTAADKEAAATARIIRKTVVTGATVARKVIQIGAEAAKMIMDASYVRQTNQASLSGSNRRSQVLQNRKTKADAALSMASSTSTTAFSTVAAFAINPALGAVQLASAVLQLGIHFATLSMTYSERMRSYAEQTEKSVAESNYSRQRLVYNTYTKRGIF